jgi:hypothetical protein
MIESEGACLFSTPTAKAHMQLKACNQELGNMPAFEDTQIILAAA